MDEFSLISRYFKESQAADAAVVLGIGDDAAVLDCRPGHQLVVAADQLIVGVHFEMEASAHSVGHKSLAVNLSDLAAMGAEPAWFTLCLALPEADASWLGQFSRGLFALANRYGVSLIGGDTTKGHLAVTIQIGGWIPDGEAIDRGGARPGDRVLVTGHLGDAAMAHELNRRKVDLPAEACQYFRRCLNYPEPRIAAGMLLRKQASAMIDISDGLIADLGHILEHSGAGAVVDLHRLPLSTHYRHYGLERLDWHGALAFGDDYELCFTAEPARVEAICSQLREIGVACSMIGEITAEPGLRLCDGEGQAYSLDQSGYRHFS